MNCLPVVERELRVAARKASTFWLRVAGAATGLVLGGGCLLVSHLQGVGTAQIGSMLFYLLTWTCLAAGLSAGLFFTSDCLSEEKREGTLGLLFMTELRGYDVAMGKLLATSLRGFYALLAVFPIVAITQLMGGITGAQYWKASLALVNGLFFSLAAGMLVSALSRDSQKALAATLFLLLLLALGGPVTDLTIAGVKKRGFEPVWSLSSPGYALAAASAWGRSAYWTAVLTTQVIGWAMLALACARVPHTWQERRRAGAATTRGWAFVWKHGGERRRQRLRRTLLEKLPTAWLACRERWQAQVLWGLAVLAVGGMAAVHIMRPDREVWILWNYCGGLFTLVLYICAASQACRLLVDARRSGLLELLLVTPVSEKQIVRGQWRGLLGMFGVPLLLLLAVQVAGAALSQLSMYHLASQVGTATASAATNQIGAVSNQTVVVVSSVSVSVSSGTNASPSPGGTPTATVAHAVGVAAWAAAATAVSTMGNLLALGWFGMWMGMTSRTANLATSKTILFVQVIPWFVITFGTAIAVGLLMQSLLFRGGSGQPTTWLVWWPLLNAALSAGAALAKDIGFIVWSRKKLYFSLREQAGGVFGQRRFVAPPPLPGPPAAPPIIH